MGFFDHVEENTHKVQLKDSLLLNLQDQVNRRIYCTKIYKQKTKKTQVKFMLSFRPNASINFVSLMVFYATFSNISVISLRSVLLVEETGGSGKKPTDLSQVTDKLYLIMLY